MIYKTKDGKFIIVNICDFKNDKIFYEFLLKIK